MNALLDLIATLHRAVPPDAPPGTRWRGSVVCRTPLGPMQVSLSAGVDAQGRRHERASCNGVRMALSTLRRLTCPEVDCPTARTVRQRWQEHQHPSLAGSADGPAPRATRGPAPARAGAPVARPLLDEVVLHVCGHEVTARPARFACHTPCPHHAHPPRTLDKAGYDLFEHGVCIAGGTTGEADPHRDEGLRPRIPTLAAAEAYVLARHLETFALLGALGVRPKA